MKNATGILIAILIWLIVPIQSWAADIVDKPFTKLPEVSSQKIRLGEGAPYCYAGYGTQQFMLTIEGQAVQSDKVSNPYLPSFDPISATFLIFGCKSDMLFVDFSTLDTSMRLDREIIHDGDTVNTIRLQYRVLTAGYTFSVMPHRLYLDLGMGYAIADYHLGRYGSQYNTEYETDDFSTGNLLIRTSVRVIINHYVMLHWQHEKSIDQTSVVDYSNRLGLNFLARF